MIETTVQELLMILALVINTVGVAVLGTWCGVWRT